jgi:hypothetical protein
MIGRFTPLQWYIDKARRGKRIEDEKVLPTTQEALEVLDYLLDYLDDTRSSANLSAREMLANKLGRMHRHSIMSYKLAIQAEKEKIEDQLADQTQKLTEGGEEKLRKELIYLNHLLSRFEPSSIESATSTAEA